MDPINEKCFAFVICILCYMIIRRLGQGKCVFGQGTGCVAVHKVVHMLLYCKNLIGMNIKIFYADSSEFPPNVHVHLFALVLILLVDSDWLISIKVGQSLTGNRNYFYLRQSWSNFDQVPRQSDVYTIKVSNQSPSK